MQRFAIAVVTTLALACTLAPVLHADPDGLCEPCETLDQDGGHVFPPRPMVTFVGFGGVGDGLRAIMQLTNPHDHGTCFLGYGPADPLADADHWTGTEWLDVHALGCGVGLKYVPLAPGASIDFEIPIGNDPRPFRGVVAVGGRQADYEVVSDRIEVPNDRIIITVEQENPQDRSQRRHAERARLRAERQQAELADFRRRVAEEQRLRDD